MDINLLHKAISREVAGAGAHELVSEFEFRLRFAAILATSCSAQTENKISLRRNLGLGGWRDLLSTATRAVDHNTILGQKVNQLGADIDNIWKSPIEGAPHGTGHLKSLRDYLNHGGRVENNAQELTVALKASLENLTTAIAAFFEGAHCGMQENHVVLDFGSENVSLFPFLLVNAGGLLIYANGGPSAPTYYAVGRGSARVVLHDMEPDIAEYFPAAVELSPVVENYLNDIIDDLAAFSEDQDRPIPIADTDTALRISWRLATSSGTEERIDEFRLGPDNLRQWLSGNEWLRYSVFLKQICNWRTVAARLATSFQSHENRNATVEAEYLGSPGNGEVIIPARVQVTDLDGKNPEKMTAEDVFATVDANADGNMGRTRITFFNGEAGSGKTHTMLRAAVQRAEHIAGQEIEDVNEPLYLYVRSTGRVLDDLSTVVQAAVASTRNLTDASVKALVRNGLLTLFIDGFDELLGNATYGDALGSLQPWLKALGGRGTLVVSARSSYFLNEYKASVAKASASALPPVQHRVAEILPWTDPEVTRYLNQCGFDPSNLAYLRSDERDLVRLPFFARIVAGLDPRVLTESEFSLVEELLKGYVHRESTKLIIGGDATQAMISPMELEQLFENAALLMAGETERQITADDLCLAAEDVIEGGLESRPRLQVRLPNLCGVGVDSGETVKRFGFQHEVYFDEFFAARVARYANSGDELSFIAALSYDNWRAATLGSVRRRVEPSQIVLLLQAAQRQIFDGRLSEAKSKNIRINAGALWAEMIQGQKLVGHKLEIRNVEVIGTMDLRLMGDAQIKIHDSRIDRLILPAAGKWHISLKGTQIHRLEYSGGSLACLVDIEDEGIASLLTTKELAENWLGITAELVRLGVNPADLKVGGSTRESLLARLGRGLLERFVQRGINSVVLLENRTFEEGDHERDAWRGNDSDLARFVRALEREGFSECVNFPAKGPKKVRLIFRVPLDTLLAKPGSPEVDNFWLSLR